jgi:hypothetical protein
MMIMPLKEFLVTNPRGNVNRRAGEMELITSNAQWTAEKNDARLDESGVARSAALNRSNERAFTTLKRSALTPIRD